MRLFFRTDCEKLHLHSRSISELSHRRVLACSSCVLGWGDAWIQLARPEDKLPSPQWHLFRQSFEWDHQQLVHHQLLELDGFRWHQRLFVFQSVVSLPRVRKRHVSVHFLAWTNDRSTRSIVGFSTSPSLSVRLPAGDSNVTMVYLSVRVRDQYGCSFEFDIPPVSIARDTTSIAMLINALQSASSHPNATSQLNSIEIVQLLLNGNQNQVNQVLVSLSQMLNTMSNDALQTALLNAENIPATALSVSSLDLVSPPRPTNASSSTGNTTAALAEYERQRNQMATVLDYLMTFVSNMPVTGANSIALQSSTLAELTKSTSHLSRDATVGVLLPFPNRTSLTLQTRSPHRHAAKP